MAWTTTVIGFTAGQMMTASERDLFAARVFAAGRRARLGLGSKRAVCAAVERALYRAPVGTALEPEAWAHAMAAARDVAA